MQKPKDMLWRSIMLALAAGAMAVSVRNRYFSALRIANWSMAASFYLIPAALWIFGALTFRREMRRWTWFVAATTGAYFAFIAFMLAGKSFLEMDLGAVALVIVFTALLVIAHAAGRVAGLEDSGTRFRLRWLYWPPLAIAGGALLVADSLIEEMGSGTGIDIVREGGWVTADFGTVPWLSRGLGWVARVDYTLIPLITVAALFLLVPALRRKLPAPAKSVFRHVAVAVGLFLIVDLYCGWLVFLSVLFFPKPFYMGFVTLAGAAVWLLAVIGGAGESPRAARARTALLWIVLPMLASDVASTPMLMGLMLPGYATALLGSLGVAMGVAQLLAEPKPAPQPVELAAAA